MNSLNASRKATQKSPSTGSATLRAAAIQISGDWEATGKVFDEFVLAYYQGTRQVADKKTGQFKTLPKFIRQKFGNLADAEREAHFILTKLANGESEVLKLTGLDRAAFVHAMQKLREWRQDAELNSAVTDYVAAVKRLPDNTTLNECVNFYLSRHPAGLPRKTVREVLDELLTIKTNAGVSEPYAKELRLCGSANSPMPMPCRSPPLAANKFRTGSQTAPLPVAHKTITAVLSARCSNSPSGVATCPKTTTN